MKLRKFSKKIKKRLDKRAEAWYFCNTLEIIVAISERNALLLVIKSKDIARGNCWAADSVGVRKHSSAGSLR